MGLTPIRFVTLAGALASVVMGSQESVLPVLYISIVHYRDTPYVHYLAIFVFKFKGPILEAAIRARNLSRNQVETE